MSHTSPDISQEAVHQGALRHGGHLCRGAVKVMLLSAEVTLSRHLSAFLISLPLNATPEGSLVSSSTGSFRERSLPPRAQRLPVALTGVLVKKWDTGGTSAYFLSFRALLRLQFFSRVRVLPISLGHPLEKC